MDGNRGGGPGNRGRGPGNNGRGPGNNGRDPGNHGRDPGNNGRGPGNHRGRGRGHGRNWNQQSHRDGQDHDPNANSSRNATSVDTDAGPSRNTTNNQSQRNGPVFGFKRLHGFLETSQDEVIMAVDRNSKEWEELLESQELCKPNSDDFLVLVIHVMGEKICAKDCNVPRQQASVVSKSLRESYINKLKTKLHTICMGSDNGIPQKRRNYAANALQVDTSSARILQNIHTFYNWVAQKMPNTALDLLQTSIPIAMGAAAALDEGDPVKQVELADAFDKLRKLFKTLSEKKKNEEIVRDRKNRFGLTKEEDEEMHEMTAPEDFREVHITPTIDEILSTEEPFLRTNKKSGAYNNADHYLDVQFRLLREDFLQPLKKGIQDFIKNRHDYLIGKKKMPLGTVRIYKDVTIIRAELIKDSFVYNIQLSENDYKRIKWNKSKRLLCGSLLVFTSDMFKNASFATVAIRDDKKIEKGILGVKWEGPHPFLDRRQSFLMVECEVYFEAYRHTLQTLKSIELNEFPMYKFIVESSSEVEAPRYLGNAQTLLKIKSRYGEDVYLNPLVDNQWPGSIELGLDEKQYEAFKAALTKEFAIIQGPPGTGKTFLGLKVTEVLLNNIETWKTEGTGPILVVCYTNHALDQFMEGILNVFQNNNLAPSMVRVGGRSQSEALEPYSLQRQRLRRLEHNALSRNYYATRSNALRELRILQNDRAELMTELMGLNDMKGIIDFKGLKVWSHIANEYPGTMWKSFDNLTWFGLADILFSINFSPYKMVNDLFNRIPASGRANPNRHVANPGQRIGGSVDDEESDEEDYDIDELMANRMIEDVYAEAETTAPKGMGHHLKYLPEFSIHNIQNMKDEIHANRATIEKVEKQFNVKKSKLQECDQKLKILNNKQEFIENLFGAYSEGSIELNNVDQIVEQAKTSTNFNLYTLSPRDKWSLFFHVVEHAKALTVRHINEKETELMEAEKTFQELMKLGDGNILLQTKVVGMTTTGAAKYNDLLKIMKSRIVIVEEAAEVLECHIVTCITKHCQHLVLIGDHRQLRPSTTVYNLAKHYHLDLSLFERMINNNLNWYQLKMQHRMRPEIANLVVGTIYEELENHDSVTLYPAVAGIRKNLFFIAHQEKEKAETDSTSKSNEHEAKFLARLCRYLVLQGYGTERITVLTTYVGQMFLLKKEIGQFQTCKGVRITCVDNFQGEENDIILLSLVRSNEQQKIGFLNVDNRVCVAISRAKHGLYICGNMAILSSNSKTWMQIKKKLEERGEIGDQIDFECQNHGTITSIGCLSDFNKVAEGGCLIPCDTLLNCGHKCQLVCHVIDREHTEYKCLLKCEKKCVNNHQCQGKCYQKCRPCTVPMEKTLIPCTHQKTLACHVQEASVTCMEAVEKTLTCGHKSIMACFKNPAELTCRVKMVKTLKCTHQKELECHEDVDLITCRVNVKKTLPCGHEEEAHCFLDPNVIRCQKIVEKVFEDCQHNVKLKCCDREKPLNCQSKCTTRLECGHACTKICHVKEDANHLSYICKKRCSRKCPAALHDCKVNHPCNKPCKPCLIMVNKLLPCGHRVNMECSYDISEYICIMPCDKILSLCGHKCQNLCYQPCDPCMVEVKQRSVDCGHFQNVPCSEFAAKRRCEERVRPKLPSACIHDTEVPCRIADTIQPQEAVKYCQFPCGELFDEKVGGCGHRCRGTCSECEQGGIHLKCQQDCKRPLVCGHICIFPCGNCPPCEQPCTMKCEHSECKRICGEPCNGCNENCTYGCTHRRCSKLCGELCDIGACEEPCPKKIKCGHPCVGFCGEPCPSLCRICDFDELTEMFIGYEDEDDARFVYLEDCKHTIESQGMDGWMKTNEEEGEIAAKRCPKCKTLIRSTKRYGNIIKKQLENVMQVKIKIFGNRKAVEEKLNTWVAKLHWDEPDRSWERLFPVLRDYLLKKLADIVPHGAGANDEKDRIVPKKIGESSMASVDLIAKYGEDAINIFRKSGDIHADLYHDLRRRYKELFEKVMKRKIPLNNMEVRDFDLEFERLHDLQQLYLRRSSPRFTDGNTAAKLYDKALRKLLSMGKYSKKIKDDIYKSLNELEDLLKTGLGISERERREILNAFNMAAGRWFKCPNGHVYIITECGGAMEESKCNECGAVIGGGSHRLRSDNALATEMDGAIAPLYPNMVG